MSEHIAHRFVSRFVRLCIVACAPFFVSPLAAQCGHVWQETMPAPGPTGSVRALAELPNGDLVAGGDFDIAGGAVAAYVARWDGSEWRAMPGGPRGSVRSLAVTPNGDLIAGGDFSQIGSGAWSRGVARWDGQAWSSMATTGVDVDVRELHVAVNGDLLVCGRRRLQYTQPWQNFAARWDGMTWSDIGTGPIPLLPIAVTDLPNGDVVVATATGFTATTNALLRSSGAAWTALPGVGAVAGITEMIALPTGQLVLASELPMLSSAYVGIWAGTQVVPLDPGIGPVSAIAVADSGEIFAGAGGYQSVVRRFDGVTWNTLPLQGVPAWIVELILTSTGDVAVGGTMNWTGIGPNPTARFDGVAWAPLGPADRLRARVAVTMPDGSVVVGGAFAEIEGVPANNIAQWGAGAWSSLGSGVDAEVTALAVAPDGSLLVGGRFAMAGGVATQQVARWDGANWSTLAGGFTGFAPIGLAQNTDGEVIALLEGSTSGNRFLRFDGQSWSWLPIPFGQNARQILAMPNGDIVFGGVFSASAQSAYGLLRYGGGGGGVLAFPPSDGYAVRAMALSPDGDLVLACSCNGASEIAVLQDNTLQPVMAVGGPVIGWNALAVLPNGDLVIGGDFDSIAGQPIDGVARYRDGSWVEVDGGARRGAVTDLAVAGNGDLICVGDFEVVDERGAPSFARGATACPADVSPFGAGCVGGAGPVTLGATNLPWIGAAFRSQVDGLGASSVAVHVIGFPVASVPLPLGALGCLLHEEPALLEPFVPAGGVTDISFAIPDVDALYGVALRTQVVGLEFGGGAALQALVSSNALDLALGLP